MATAYTKDQVDNILSIYLLNHGNMRKTAKLAEVSRTTLIKMLDTNPEIVKLAGKKVIESKIEERDEKRHRKTPKTKIARQIPKFRATETDVMPQILRDSTMDPDVLNEKLKHVHDTNLARLAFLNKSFTAKEKLIDKLIELTEYEMNMDNVQKSIKTLHEITKPEIEDDPTKGKTEETNYFQIINNNLIQAGYGIKNPIRTQEDQQEPSGDNMP